jgi:protein-S-isoprenylcysteine O-methyltransferase Ste14
MIARWIPLVLVLSFLAAVRWRILFHRRRFGGAPVHFDKSGNRRQRFYDRAGAVLFAGLWLQAVFVALGRVALAEGDLARVAGALLGFGGIAAMLSAQLQMGASWRIGIDPAARTPLVRHGWYRLSRNPIYVFVFVFLASQAVLVPNAFTWLVCAWMVLGVNMQVRKEERWLDATFGDEWRAYASRVGRFVPGIGRLPRDQARSRVES